MNVSPSRPRLWTPQTIVLAVLLHAVVLYYVAVTLNIAPPIIPPTSDPPHYTTVRINPTPPEIKPDPVEPKQPRFRPHHTTPPPVDVQVPQAPFPPQPATESTAGAGVIALNTELQEQPVSQALPRYPPIAQARDIEGQVVMSITIMPDGSVRDVQVVNAQPRGYFESTAVRAVRTWRYRPSNVTRTNVIVHMDFVLRNT